MEKYVIGGGKPLFGEIAISGAKNAALAIIPATVLVKGVCRLENIPNVNDVLIQLDILRQLGANVRRVNAVTIEIDCTNIKNSKAPYDMTRRIRASYYLIGSLLGRFNLADVALPGGCNFGGVRPIDQHIKGFEALGASINIINGAVVAAAEHGLNGTSIYLDVVTVGATMNIMLAATLAKGQTVIENAAKEPHIVDLANFLNSMGADIMGAGTDVIKIRGVEELHGGVYSIIPDQIEAGTYMAAVAATGGSLLIKNVIPKHLECITAKLSEMGVEIEEFDEAVRVTRTGAELNRVNLKTLPYPGFPTDMQPQFTTLLAMANGTSTVTEGVWENRYRYVDELRRMGARIKVDGRMAVVEGVPRLSGASVRATDLRAGAAMVIAGLAAEGETIVEEIQHIERGYEKLVEKLRSVGADIALVEYPDEEKITLAQS
ncbi:MAG: UDP-N-acetylglucosamine 1-carboxyvinyltransferase [Clostridia bacterium]|nr:UDP-N-acetylglucosamine 1-carboxyvinyltransferase [Clostridia bacterium]